MREREQQGSRAAGQQGSVVAGKKGSRAAGQHASMPAGQQDLVFEELQRLKEACGPREWLTQQKKPSKAGGQAIA